MNQFGERVQVNNGSWTSGLFGVFLIFMFFCWPAMVWENDFVYFLVLIGIVVVYFSPIWLCSIEIPEHSQIKKNYRESYDKLLQQYDVKHPHKTAIVLLTWFLGWTGVGWLIAFYLAHGRRTLDLPSGFVRELNNLHRQASPHYSNVSMDMHAQSSRPQVPIASASLSPIQSTAGLQTTPPPIVSSKPPPIASTKPPLIIRKNAICRTCGASNSVIVTRDSHHACEFCGGALEVKTA
jgi:hypothetical protein